jgi:hypothetical protein
MSTCTEADGLTDLARVLLAVVTPDDPPIAVGVSDAGHDEGDLHLKPLLGGDPAAELRGFRCPDEWQTFGIASRARLRSLDPDGPEPEQTSFVFLVGRSGAAIALAGDDLGRPLRLEARGEQCGRVPDACRRALGLATPPPPCDTRTWFALQWLDRACEIALEEARRFSWEQLAGLYPLATPAFRAELPGPLAEHLIMLGDIAGSVLDWDRLRERAIADDPGGCRLAPHEAAWTDEGTFARILLEPYPELADLVEILQPRLEPDTQAQLAATLHAWRCL